MKRFSISIFTFIIFILAITYIAFFSKYDTLKHCEFLNMDEENACFTNRIYLHGINIYFKNAIYFPANDIKTVIYIKNIPIKDALHIRGNVRNKAILDTITLWDINKISLANDIIKKHSAKIYYKEINEDVYKKVLEDISYIIATNESIKKAEKVIKLSDNDINALPIQLLKYKNTKIKYAVFYKNNIVNYYDDHGNIVLRKNLYNGDTLRFQTIDSDNNFYTFDKNLKLIEYSKDNAVYNSDGEFIYYISTSKPYITTILAQPEINNSGSGVEKKRNNLMTILNDKNSHLHISLSKAVDKSYSKGSTELIIKDLTEYLKTLKKQFPDEYSYFYIASDTKPISLDFIKTNDGYVFSVNGAHNPDTDILSSLGETINVYNGRCAEIILKSEIKKEQVNNYIYDLKIEKDSNGELQIREVQPCETCSKNISLWGWKYPKTTILQ